MQSKLETEPGTSCSKVMALPHLPFHTFSSFSCLSFLSIFHLSFHASPSFPYLLFLSIPLLLFHISPSFPHFTSLSFPTSPSFLSVPHFPSCPLPSLPAQCCQGASGWQMSISPKLCPQRKQSPIQKAKSLAEPTCGASGRPNRVLCARSEAGTEVLRSGLQLELGEQRGAELGAQWNRAALSVNTGTVWAARGGGSAAAGTWRDSPEKTLKSPEPSCSRAGYCPCCMCPSKHWHWGGDEEGCTLWVAAGHLFGTLWG